MMTCETCGAPTGWVEGVSLERANESKREAMAEATRLRAALKTANEQAERFERGWYLRGDALEMVKEAAILQRGLDFNLTTDQWKTFHTALTPNV